MLCDKCQQREATCHITNATSIAGDVPTTSDLCSECFETSSPIAREVATAWQAGCCYCGGEPYCGCPDLSVVLSGVHRRRAICRQCWQEFNRVMLLKLPG